MFAGKHTALRSEIVGDRTSALASVIESYACEPLGELAEERIVADFDELHRGIEALKSSGCAAWRRSTGEGCMPATGSYRRSPGWVLVTTWPGE
jgi:hypothetical protein